MIFSREAANLDARLSVRSLSMKILKLANRDGEPKQHGKMSRSIGWIVIVVSLFMVNDLSTRSLNIVALMIDELWRLIILLNGL